MFWQTLLQWKINYLWKWKNDCVTVTPHLSLLVLEHFIDAGVEGRAREHGGDGIGQVQDCFEYRVHCLLNNKIKRNGTKGLCSSVTDIPLELTAAE